LAEIIYRKGHLIPLPTQNGQSPVKEIKQNLKIKTFFGTSENAVMTHIWVALSTYLILAFMRFKAGLGISFQQRLRLLQINLFDRRNLIDLCTPQPYDGAASPLLRAV
jgi:hypothetical protein